ncbi:hypothetical protein CDAR_163811 [Caerostris darwini]|uniref:Uncharacterized protein n=1 Tax=Caerostris darwini TaxID=1538125 RepID=A0AAV4UVK9_9ARAC|nr:hypothetical protein CDAR_163811 [Caerostris darwini]
MLTDGNLGLCSLLARKEILQSKPRNKKTSNKLDQGRYLLGNRAASLFKRMKSVCVKCLPHQINAVTRTEGDLKKKNKKLSITRERLTRKDLVLPELRVEDETVIKLIEIASKHLLNCKMKIQFH